MRPVLWSASTHTPISFKVNWKRRMSMTSPLCLAISMRSPTSKGRRHTMNAHPARFVSGSLSAMAIPADDQDADNKGDVGDRFAPAVARPRVRNAPVDDREDESLDEPESRDHDDRDQQVHLYRGAQPEAVLEPVAHGGQSYRAS